MRVVGGQAHSPPRPEAKFAPVFVPRRPTHVSPRVRFFQGIVVGALGLLTVEIVVALALVIFGSHT